jgi:hypothetical protein
MFLKCYIAKKLKNYKLKKNLKMGKFKKKLINKKLKDKEFIKKRSLLKKKIFFFKHKKHLIKFIKKEILTTLGKKKNLYNKIKDCYKINLEKKEILVSIIF